jgi:putative membrane protein
MFFDFWLLKKNMKTFWSWALAMTFLVAIACDDDDNDSASTLQQADRDFVLNASEANLAEIQLGTLAGSKSGTSAVNDFGDMMASEHQTALDELESIADLKNATMTRQLSSEHQQLQEKLMSMDGFAFDTAYMNSQIKDHQKAIALFQTEISNGKDQQVKEYARKYLPHIQMHHHKADSIRKTLEQ